MEQIAKNINFAICITVRYADGKNNGGTLQEKWNKFPSCRSLHTVEKISFQLEEFWIALMIVEI